MDNNHSTRDILNGLVLYSMDRRKGEYNMVAQTASYEEVLDK